MVGDLRDQGIACFFAWPVPDAETLIHKDISCETLGVCR